MWLLITNIFQFPVNNCSKETASCILLQQLICSSFTKNPPQKIPHFALWDRISEISLCHSSTMKYIMWFTIHVFQMKGSLPIQKKYAAQPRKLWMLQLPSLPHMYKRALIHFRFIHPFALSEGLSNTTETKCFKWFSNV